MNSRITYYLFLMALIVLDAVLIRSPNLIGKLGLWFYKYHYLRTFPKALLTVTLVVGICAIIAETVRFLVKKRLIKRLAGQVIFFLLIVLAFGLMGKVIMDFSAGSYSHTGIRFKSGAYLLPGILVVVFLYNLITLPRQSISVPETALVNSNAETNDD